MKISLGFFAIFLTLFSLQVTAQDNSYEGLAKMFSQPTTTGSARFQAIGGNHSALGADVSSATGNPAGLGFYTRSEFSFTPAFQSNSNSSLYGRENSPTTNSKVNNLNIANIGVVFGGSEPSYREGWRGSFAISYSRQNSFYNNIQFTGIGSGYGGSITDSYAEFVNNQTHYDKNLNPNPLSQSDLLAGLNNGAPNNFPNTANLYYWSYLINAVNNTDTPFDGIEPTSKVNQSYDFQSTGRTSQWSIAYGGTANEHFYIGGSLGIPSYRYESIKNFTENFQNYQEIKGFTDTRQLVSSGSGLNLTLGTIIKPNDNIRFGFTIVTPTWYSVEETSSASLNVNVDPAKGIDIGTNPDQAILTRLGNVGYKTVKKGNNIFITSIPKLSRVNYDDNYELRTPLKLTGGVALFFKKKGFISADIEYIAYKGMNLSTTDQDLLNDDDFLNAQPNIKLFYNNVLNFKVGGEYRMNNVSLRGGINYLQNPYSTAFDNSKTIDRSQMIYSAGIGYRTSEFYVDLTGLYGSTQSSATPYRLNDTKAYASTKIDNSYTRGLITFGVFF
jgi:hypothetical protein